MAADQSKGRSASRLQGGALAGVALILIAIGFVATVLLANNALKTARVDLTEEGLFTLSEGTRNVIQAIDEPVTLRFYFSERLAREIPQIGLYGQRVQDMLEEFAAVSEGKIRLEIYDPLPFTDVEDNAVAYGLKGVPVDQTGETVYFGLAGVNSTNQQLAIPFFDERREPFLEYDLARMVYGLAHPDKPKIGIITQLPLSGSRYAKNVPDAQDDSWMVWAQAENLFDLEEIDPLTEQLPKDLDLLVLIHPPFMSDLALYAIDQFVMEGGRVVAFIDPYSEADAQRPPTRGGQKADFGSAATMKKLLDAWGVEVPEDRLAGDVKLGQKVQAPNEARTRMLAVQYPLWMQLRQENVSQQEIVTSQLQSIRIASPGYIVGKEGGLTVEPIIETSDQGGTVDVARVQGRQPDIVGIANDMKPEGKFTLAARLTGTAKTAFPDGPPQPIAMKKDDASEEQKAEAKKRWEEEKANHLAESKDSVNIILTADVDMLADALWVRVQDLFGQRIAVPSANNGAYFQNLLENLTGSADLIGLRSRGGLQRPFTLIQDIQREAEQRFRAKEQELLASLEETERKLGQVRESTDATGDSRIVLSDKQRAEMNQFQEDLLRIRKELRDVQFALRSDVEELNGRIKLINIAAMPIAVALIAIIAAFARARWRRGFQARFTDHAGA